MKKLPPILVIASGLVMLACAIVLMGDFFFSYLPDRQTELTRQRQQVADLLAVPTIDMLGKGEIDRLATVLHRIAEQEPDIESLAVRRQDGRLIVATRRHAQLWPATGPHVARDHLLSIPVRTDSQVWGAIEIAFAAPRAGVLAFLERHPALGAILTLIVFGLVTFSLYIRRILHQFDPKSVIPDRVRAAFDAMAEGVVIIDNKGRIALANNRFRSLGQGTTDQQLTARPLSGVPWLSHYMPGEAKDHPWNRSMRELIEITGVEIAIEPGGEDEQARLLVVNCAPITDGQRQARGCMVTFDDVTALHRANRRLEYTLRQLQDSRREVEHKAADLERLASVDYLTGVLNRRAFSEQSEQAFAHAAAEREPFSCMMIDIDFFKKINDTYGHSVGDLVIKAVAEILMACTRDGDLVGRYGGEEFCVALPNTGLTAATTIAQRIRESIERDVSASLIEVKGLKVTTSVGVAVFDRHYLTMHALIASADEALYEAKESGRNRVRVASSETIETEPGL